MKKYPKVNLQVIRPNRQAGVHPGTVFTFLLPNNKYGFGILLRKNVLDGTAPVSSADLLFFYDSFSDKMKFDPGALRANSPLIPPVWTNPMGWTRGYFVSVGEVELASPYVPERMCFYDIAKKRYVDEYGRGLMTKREPCGDYLGVSYRWIDDRLSDAIGWPRVPVEEEE